MLHCIQEYVVREVRAPFQYAALLLENPHICCCCHRNSTLHHAWIFIECSSQQVKISVNGMVLKLVSAHKMCVPHCGESGLSWVPFSRLQIASTVNPFAAKTFRHISPDGLSSIYETFVSCFLGNNGWTLVCAKKREKNRGHKRVSAMLYSQVVFPNLCIYPSMSSDRPCFDDVRLCYCIYSLFCESLIRKIVFLCPLC